MYIYNYIYKEKSHSERYQKAMKTEQVRTLPKKHADDKMGQKYILKTSQITTTRQIADRLAFVDS